MSDTAEARLAVEAAKQTGLEVVACMVFDSGRERDRTMMGTTPEEAARVLVEAGADCIGSNCGQGIEGFVSICRRLCGHGAADLDQGQRGPAGNHRWPDCLPPDPGRIRQPGARPGRGRRELHRRLLWYLARVHPSGWKETLAMNSRERVLLAINHQEADRLPIDVGATRQTGIAASTYHLLKRRLGLSTPTRVYDVYQMLADIEQPILDRFGADCVGLNRPAVAFGIRNEGWKPWTLPDGTPVEVPGGFNPSSDRLGNLVLYDAGGAAIAKMPKGGLYFDRLGTFPGAAPIRRA